MRSVVNSISLDPGLKRSDTRSPSIQYFIIDPSGESDELRYSRYWDAVEAVIDSSPEMYRAVEQGLKNAGIKRRYGMHEDDYQSDRSNWLSANAKEILKDSGFRIMEVIR